MKKPQISIIIPCYNCETLVRETLESLVLQTCKDFEVICINDGSEDGTAETLEMWKSKNLFPMQIIHQENGGVSCARNAGIAAAKGEYILFLDADDCYHKEFLERLHNALLESNADVSYCMLSRNENAVKNAVIAENDWFAVQKQPEFMRNLLYRMPEFGFYCYLYKTEVLRENGILFDVNTRHFEDREFNWKYLCHCRTAAYVNAPLYWYRVNINSVTQNKVITWKTEDLCAVERVEAYLQKHHCAFYPELKAYLFARVLWGKAMRYAAANRKDLFNKLRAEYNVKACMRRTAKDSNKLVALASRCYLVHPSLFYHIVRLKK